jgi:uncharacterized protein (DUF427 family)
MNRPVKTPGPDHPIEISAAGGAFRAVCAGLVLAHSTRALALQEARYPQVVYFPREDVDLSLLEQSATISWCPYKGEASYFSVKANDVAGVAAVADVAWSYEAPPPAMQGIASCVAFYANKVVVEAA